MEITILMPCLNEAKSLAFCVNEAKSALERLGLEGEILIADNGSTDGSPEIAREAGARVVSIAERGYGAALIGGIRAARGRYVIMGDADGSYVFSEIDPFVEALREGNDLVVGNRFRGGIQKGAMPPSHHVGVRFLSLIARWRFHAPVGDFHCGLRGFDREKSLALDLRCGGMEFATEIIGKFAWSGARITQVPTPLRKDLREGGRPHLRTIRDGFRHLRIILFCPK